MENCEGIAACPLQRSSQLQQWQHVLMDAMGDPGKSSEPRSTGVGKIQICTLLLTFLSSILGILFQSFHC